MDKKQMGDINDLVTLALHTHLRVEMLDENDEYDVPKYITLQSELLEILKEEEYRVPMIDKIKEHRLNPRTNRMKNFKTTKYLTTDIPPEKRTFQNLPRYSTKKPKVRFQDWLMIQSRPMSSSSTVHSWGWAPNNKCYGWSHRAVHGFAIGEVIKPGTIGNSEGKTFTLKTRQQVEDMAKKFAREIS